MVVRVVQIRPAKKEDIDDVAILFNTNPNYVDPYFNTAELISQRLDEIKVAVVAVEGKQIAGFVEAQDYYYGVQEAGGSVAEVKKLFVNPLHQGRGIAQKLYESLERSLISLSYDAAVASAVCGHPVSQGVFVNNGYFPTAFTPLWAREQFTRSGKRESMLFVMKFLSDGFREAALEHRTVYAPEEFSRLIGTVYASAGLAGKREIVTRLNEKTILEQFIEDYASQLAIVSGKGSNEIPVSQHVLPLASIDLVQPMSRYKVAVGISKGFIPAGVFPFAKTDIMLLMYVPNMPGRHDLEFEPSKVQIVEAGKPLVSLVADSYAKQRNSELSVTSLPQTFKRN